MTSLTKNGIAITLAALTTLSFTPSAFALPVSMTSVLTDLPPIDFAGTEPTLQNVVDAMDIDPTVAFTPIEASSSSSDDQIVVDFLERRRIKQWQLNRANRIREYHENEVEPRLLTYGLTLDTSNSTLAAQLQTALNERNAAIARGDSEEQLKQAADGVAAARLALINEQAPFLAAWQEQVRSAGASDFQ